MRRLRGRGVVVLILALSGPAFGEATPDDAPKAQLTAIQAAQNAARARFHEALAGKTTADAQKEPIDRYLAEVHKNTSAVLNLVRAHPHDPFVVDALHFVIRTARAGPGDESYQAMEILLRDHVTDPGIGAVCKGLSFFGHAPIAETLLRAVGERHPDRNDRGQATFERAEYLQFQATMVRRIRANPEAIDEYVHERHRAATEAFVKATNPDSLDRESEQLLERVVAEYADVKSDDDHRPLGIVAEGKLFAARNLAVGKIAPEITGKDHEGKPFALSDVRGKVIVLTFSGNWCGPCVGMYPQERELIAAHKNEAFALLSVNTDERVETLQEAIASGAITWRCWWDGGATGPITTRWGVLGFPAIFVLDRKGVIRFKDLRGEALDRAVARLLAETTGSER